MPDPDFSEALLLEQYQAQVSSALTPAFGADSSPDLASAAVDVCATFVATGLVTDVDRMGRILKLLVTALESFTGKAIGMLWSTFTHEEQMMLRILQLENYVVSAPTHKLWSEWQCCLHGPSCKSPAPNKNTS